MCKGDDSSFASIKSAAHQPNVRLWKCTASSKAYGISNF
jgi:hypothetical protein